MQISNTPRFGKSYYAAITSGGEMIIGGASHPNSIYVFQPLFCMNDFCVHCLCWIRFYRDGVGRDGGGRG